VPQSQAQVQQLFRSGIDAIASVTDQFTDDDWARPACGSWTARQTATHVLGVVDWYHEWLDRAIAGDPTRPFPEAEVDEHADDDVQRLADVSGPDAIARFQARAYDYLQRTTAHWDITYAYPFGVVATGLHCGVAATEWHLHAWDLAKARSHDYAPADPASLLIAAGSCVATARGGIRGTVIKRLLPFAAKRTPWKTLLEQSGRPERDT